MRVKCANCGMIYDILSSDIEFRDERQILDSGICPSCRSNAKDIINDGFVGSYTYKQGVKDGKKVIKKDL